MLKKFVIGFVLVLMLGLACADEWGEIGGENGSAVAGSSDGAGVSGLDSENISSVQNESVGVPSDQAALGQDSTQASVSRSTGSSAEYTEEFNIALWLMGVAIFIVIVFVYFFIRKPKNRWK